MPAMDATVMAARAMAQAVTRSPRDRKAHAQWLEATTAVYPPGWLENGGPIRTWRKPMGTRHTTVAGTPFGYDLGVLKEPSD
jgi:hypothetical protein